MQIVMLSARPDVAAETLEHIRHFMPWTADVVIVAPARLVGAFAAIERATVLTDEELLGRSTAEIATLDHMTRNFELRGAVARRGGVATEFLMCDDDHRPLKAVGLDEFRTEDGRDRSFYFYDLSRWPGNETPFDEGQHNAAELLGYLGYDRLAFGSHMPQLIRRDLLVEAWDVAQRLTDRRQICEWALYFNIARARHPELFADPEPFRTLCWPQYPHEWPWWVTPDDFAFENFYPELYAPGHLFAGLPTHLDAEQVERHNVEKILRWSAFGRRVARLDFPDDIVNPWTSGSATRRASFGVLRGLRKAYDYVSLDDRARITELQGEVDRLRRDHSPQRGDATTPIQAPR